MIVQRDTKIAEFLLKGRSVLVLGPRATGKSYYLKFIFAGLKNTIIVDLLARDAFHRYLRHPSRFYDEVSSRARGLSQEHGGTEKLFVLVDEIQLLPDLLYEVHRLIEDFRSICVFALTGSSARKLRRIDSDLLAARALSFKFFPFTSSEVPFEESLDKILQYGTLPEVFLESDPPTIVEILKTYTEKYLREEIQQESLVRNLPGFSRFLELAAFSHGEPINYAKIGKSAGLRGETVKEYYQILIDTLLGVQVPAWEHSVRKQLTKAPKFYFFDTGVINALRGELTTELKPSSYRYGKLFESMVINEILRAIEARRLSAKLHHYRTNHGQEIDLVIQKNIASSPMAIEIKSGSSPELSDVRSLGNFREEFPEARCLVLCRTPRAYDQAGIEFVPWHEGIELLCGQL